ncbi:MAG: hypothetical protein WBD95_01750 [Xanthobacteraceae bacterium]
MITEIERLRLQYRPERITVLFVGEARPASDCFFHRGNSGLTNYMRDVLGGPKGDVEFLNWFKARRWYLDDLVMTPIENLRERRKQCREARASLASRIAEYQPAAIGCLLKSICDDVEIATSKANSKAPPYTVPFAGQGHQTKFNDQMKRILPELPVGTNFAGLSRC